MSSASVSVASDPGVKADSFGRPFCFECGYDLSGLELPRPCPECGRHADPAIQASEAREWFKRRPARLRWLVRPQTVPPGFWFVLSDAASAELARRRVIRWLWLPAVLVLVTVGAGCFLTVEYDVKVWYYERSDAERKPIRVVTDSETDRLFAFNLHLFRGGFFFTKPASWVRVVERRPRDFGVGMPKSLDHMLLFWGCSPLLLLLFGYLPARESALAWLRCRARRQGRADLANATRTAWSVISVPLGMAVWMWLVAAWVHGVGELLGFRGIASTCLVTVAGGWWLLVTLIGYAVLVKPDRSRIIVGSRIGLWAVVVILSVGGPVAVGWALLQMLL